MKCGRSQAEKGSSFSAVASGNNIVVGAGVKISTTRVIVTSPILHSCSGAAVMAFSFLGSSRMRA